MSDFHRILGLIEPHEAASKAWRINRGKEGNNDGAVRKETGDALAVVGRQPACGFLTLSLTPLH